MTTERLTISFDPEKGELHITDGRMMSSLGKLVPVMTMSGPADKREELVARFNAARGNWGLPPLPDPDLPTKPPVSDVPISSSLGTDPLTRKPLRKPPPPEHPASVPQSPSPAPTAARTVWEQYENRHDDYPWRDRNDALLFDKWWTYRMAARFDEKEIKGSGKTYGKLAAKFLRENYKAEAPYAKGERKVRIIPDYAHDKHTTSGQRMGRGVEYFFDVGGVLVNCTLPDPYLDRAREICIAKEKRAQRERWLKADADHAWNRLLVISSEDVGLAADSASLYVKNLHDLYSNNKKSGESRLYFIHAILLLARAPKSRIVDHATIASFEVPREKRALPD